MSTPAELPIAQRRALLAEKRDRYLALALDATAETVAMSVQTNGVTARERNQAIRQFQDKAANCQAAATEIDKLLNALPDEAAPAAPEVP